MKSKPKESRNIKRTSERERRRSKSPPKKGNGLSTDEIAEIKNRWIKTPSATKPKVVPPQARSKRDISSWNDADDTSNKIDHGLIMVEPKILKMKREADDNKILKAPASDMRRS